MQMPTMNEGKGLIKFKMQILLLWQSYEDDLLKRYYVEQAV